MRPLLIGQCRRVVGVGDVYLAAVVKFGLFPRLAPRAFDEFALLLQLFDVVGDSVRDRGGAVFVDQRPGDEAVQAERSQ
jgi:hypothetical protein